MIISSLVVVTGVAAGFGGIWYAQSQAAESNPVAASNGGSVPLSISESSSQTVPLSQFDASPSQTGNNTDNTQNNTGNSLKVNDNTQNPSNNSNAPQTSSAAPTLAELEQYDTSYRDKDSAFFGDLKVGDGEEAVSGKTIVVDYRGWLTDGRIFDESYQTGKHFEFVLGKQQVITGWEEGIAGMKVGGKRRIIVPPSVGYGAKAVGPIPANSLLVFDVELLDVQPTSR